MNELIQAVSALPHLHAAAGSLLLGAASCTATATSSCIGSLITEVQPWITAAIPLGVIYAAWKNIHKVESHVMLAGEVAAGTLVLEGVWNAILVPIISSGIK